MKYFFDNLSKIRRRMEGRKKYLLMFDFDGTLSKITVTPKKAYLKNSTKNLLKKLSKRFYIAIISGRTLSDIKSKVGLSNLIYAGNHGLEWQIGKSYKKIKVPLRYLKNLSVIKKRIQPLTLNYNGSFIENKLLTLSLHYRLLNKKSIKGFLKEFSRITSFIKRGNIFLINKAKKAIEIRPKVAWNKGLFAKFLIKHLEKRNYCPLFTFYVGDDKTDEDAFKVLQRGITVRMGKKQQSSAKYFIKTNEIDKLLSRLLKNYYDI